jgi:hypothetical protein
VSGLQNVTTSKEPRRIVVVVDDSMYRTFAARQSRMVLRSVIALCRKKGAASAAPARIGAPAVTVDRVARELGAKQIVMGTRDLGSLGDLFSALSQLTDY